MFADNLELVLQPSAIPESGTASVRARPTVKHLTVSLPPPPLLGCTSLRYLHVILFFAYLNDAVFACDQIVDLIVFIMIVFIWSARAEQLIRERYLPWNGGQFKKNQEYEQGKKKTRKPRCKI